MFTDKFLISIHGRQIGLQRVTTAISGGTRGQFDFLAGTYKGERIDTSTADTTATNLLPFGNHLLPVSSVGSSQVFVVDPPIPGSNPLVVMNNAVDACYLKSLNGEGFQTSAGSSFTVVKLSSLGAPISFTPMTSSLWAVSGNGSTASGHSYSTTT
jgi:hypothetical protein